MTQLFIEPDEDLANVLTIVEMIERPTIEYKCPYCKLPIQQPLIARKRDQDRFKRMMCIAEKVMKEMGITDHLLSNIVAHCYIEIARKGQEEK